MTLGDQGLINLLKNAIHRSDSGSSGSSGSEQQSSFHLFPSLPAELRRKFWHHALPDRIMEAHLCKIDGEWHYRFRMPNPKLDARKMPVLFSVNVESRELCLEQYVLFSNQYIHPRLDILFISWSDYMFNSRDKKIEGRPLDEFDNVIFSAVQNRGSNTRFGYIIECIKDLGSPATVSLGFDGPKLPYDLTDLKGYSMATGQQVIMLKSIPDPTLYEDPPFQKTARRSRGCIS